LELQGLLLLLSGFIAFRSIAYTRSICRGGGGNYPPQMVDGVGIRVWRLQLRNFILKHLIFNVQC